MRYSLKQVFRNRKNTFSDSWFEIVKTRFVLCVFIVLFSLLTLDSHNLKNILIATAIYAFLNLSLGLWKSRTLWLKRVRAIPALIDVVFISVLIYLTGGQNSPWFLLYFFPIISVARYLSYEGSLPLMAFTVVAYFVVAHISNSGVADSTLILRSLVFLGIALVAGNLTREGQRREDKLLGIFNEVDNAILNASANKVIRLILRKALEFTGSEMGQMRILNAELNSSYTITLESESEKHQWNITLLTDRYCERVIKSKKPFVIHNIKEAGHIREAGHLPKSALCVPLILNGEVQAIIALYSQNRFHQLKRSNCRVSHSYWEWRLRTTKCIRRSPSQRMRRKRV
jgi:hypothetical protein